MLMIVSEPPPVQAKMFLKKKKSNWVPDSGFLIKVPVRLVFNIKAGFSSRTIGIFINSLAFAFQTFWSFGSQILPGLEAFSDRQ